jgi:2-amino-4-hydroxy-6-hydroxymethyldihydropteridine diphosphokinase
LKPSLYLIGIGSNQRHPLAGDPRRIVAAAIEALEMPEIDVFADSRVITSAPLGPSARRYANAAILVSSPLSPSDMLDRLHAVEQHFGRDRRGARWRARTLDLDILAWSEGMWVSDSPALAIPHPALRYRTFALGPAAEIAPTWRDPVTGLTLRQLFHRLTRPKPLDRRQAAH